MIRDYFMMGCGMYAAGVLCYGRTWRDWAEWAEARLRDWRAWLA